MNLAMYVKLILNYNAILNDMQGNNFVVHLSFAYLVGPRVGAGRDEYRVSVVGRIDPRLYRGLIPWHVYGGSQARRRDCEDQQEGGVEVSHETPSAPFMNPV